MQIELKNLGKRFNRQWIFRNLDFTFLFGNNYAITGHNGSGKSTLLQIIAGSMDKSEGSVSFLKNGKIIDPERQFQSIAFSAPYLELLEELTLNEFLKFHFSLKPILGGWTIPEITDVIDLSAAKQKQLRYFSSGMMQRVKLAQAFFSDAPFILLDEPTANLDLKGIDLYLWLINEVGKSRTILICSNDEKEISFCNQHLDITDYKKK